MVMMNREWGMGHGALGKHEGGWIPRPYAPHPPLPPLPTPY
jgi:hypothetical protein